MKKVDKVLAGSAAGLAALAGAAWVGLQVKPAPFPPLPDHTPPLEYVALPDDLPPPVARYFRRTVGEQVPVLDTAVIGGRATLRFGGIPFPARFRFTYKPGRSYHHNIEATIFGQPLLKADETYVDGAARLVLPFGVTENEPKVDMAANLGLWGEAIWTPSVLVTDPRVRWEAIDEATARLVVPFAGEEDNIIFTFDPQTGLIVDGMAQRYRDAGDEEKLPWRLEPLGWQTFHGMQIPSPAAVQWLDQTEPWAVFELEDVRYNIPVSPPL